MPSASVGTIVHAVKSVPMPIDLGGVDAGVGDRAADRRAHRLDVVLRVLQRPVRRQRLAGDRQLAVDHAVAVGVHGRADLGAVGDAHDHGPGRQRPEVDADDVLVGARRGHQPRL